MLLLGFTLARVRGMYMDGHEREDVTKYREDFVERFGRYESFMDSYETFKGYDGQIVTHEIIRGIGVVGGALDKQPIIFVTHDECCAKANVTNSKMYFHNQGATDGSAA